LAFAFVFFDKIFGVMAEKSTIPPIIAVWIPNIVFGILAVYLLEMPNDNVKSYLHLHLIVFIWGFTAVLGKL
jgi:hypothetical protein